MFEGEVSKAVLRREWDAGMDLEGLCVGLFGLAFQEGFEPLKAEYRKSMSRVRELVAADLGSAKVALMTALTNVDVEYCRKRAEVEATLTGLALYDAILALEVSANAEGDRLDREYNEKFAEVWNRHAGPVDAEYAEKVCDFAWGFFSGNF